MLVINDCVKTYLEKFRNNSHPSENINEQVKIFYENQMNSQYKKDEKIMKNIIRKNVKSVYHNKDIATIIYYCNRKVNNIIMTNNLNRNDDPLAMSHAVYEIKSPVGGCELLNPSYIGQTRNKIRTRLSQHRQNGAIIEHLASHHNITNITLEKLASNVCVLQKLPVDNKLFIYEALSILDRKPDLNIQIDNFINPFKLFSRGTYIPLTRARSLLNVNPYNRSNNIPPTCRYSHRSHAL